MTRAAKTKPPRGREGWYTNDQRLLAEIRDLLIDVAENTDRILDLHLSVRRTNDEVASTRKALDKAANAMTELAAAKEPVAG
jgi:hypothetical protein